MYGNGQTFFDFLFKFFVSIYSRDFRIAVIQCFFVDICLNFFEQFLNICFDAIASHSFFFQCIAAHWDGTTETEEKIKEDTKATIRCIPFDSYVEGDKEPGKCMVTGKPSACRVVFARSY